MAADNIGLDGEVEETPHVALAVSTGHVDWNGLPVRTALVITLVDTFGILMEAPLPDEKGLGPVFLPITVVVEDGLV
jgi:hypothetical protein